MLTENKQLLDELEALKCYVKDLSITEDESQENNIGCFNLKNFRKKSVRRQSEGKSKRKALFQ